MQKSSKTKINGSVEELVRELACLEHDISGQESKSDQLIRPLKVRRCWVKEALQILGVKFSSETGQPIVA